MAQRGLSDIVSGDKKIAGTSLFRKKYLLVYQGSLLVDPEFDLIFELLKHPSREPDYRQGRDHKDFVTSLRELGCSTSASVLAKSCQEFFSSHVGHALGSCYDESLLT